MLEPPSEKTVALLSELGLCTPADFRRCRSRVRRLAHDLPAFDSIWIDALVQARKLTSFQARILESCNPQQLRVGPCVLIDRLGTAAAQHSFLARRINGNERCALKLLDVSTELYRETASRIAALVRSQKNSQHPNIVVPHAFTETLTDETARQTRRIAVISRYVPALHLAELLIRRGRFPAMVVQSIGRQLLNGLADLESAGFVHGDITLKNAQLTTGGAVVLVDAGINVAVNPEFKVNAAVAPEKYFGIAPELVGTGNSSTVASDLYALGCLLWHLLAGRPPHSIGDPLALLAAHQTTPIPDVRQWAPDTPAGLAEAILNLTAQQPNDRPHSARQALQQWTEPRRADYKRLSQFRAMFETTVPRIPTTRQHNRSNRWSVLLTVLFVLSGVSLTLIDHGARSHLLNLAARVSPRLQSLQNSPAADSDNAHREHGNDRVNKNRESSDNNQPVRTGRHRLFPMPAPDAAGVIRLKPGTKYEAAMIAAVGPVTIQREVVPAVKGNSPNRIPQAEIIITDQPLRIWSSELTLDNILVRLADHDGHQRPLKEHPPALLLVETGQLTIHSCSFLTDSIDRIASRVDTSAVPTKRVPSQTIAAIAWKPIVENVPGTGTISVTNTVFATESNAFHLARPPQTVHITNCLKLGTGAFLRYQQPPIAGRTSNIRLNHVTLRRASSLIRINIPTETSIIGYVSIDADHCVFDLPPHSGSLVEWHASSLPENWIETIELVGAGCLANADVVVASQTKALNTSRVPLDASRMQIEGIATAPFDFSSPISGDLRTSEITSFVGPSRSSQLPGIDASRLR